MVGFLKNKFTRYLIIIVCIFILLISIFFINNKASSVLGEEQAPYTLLGWLWSEGYGWISLNSNNCKPVGGLCCAGDCGVSYSVNLSTTTDDVYGWGWSSNVGWVCFGNGNEHFVGGVKWGCTTTPPNSSLLEAKFNNETGKLTGWAQILSLGNNGWIHLGSTSTANLTHDYLPACYNCEASCQEWTVKPDLTTSSPCLQESTSTFSNCKICFSQTRLLPNRIPYPGFDASPLEPANFPDPNIVSVSGGSGLICEDCQNCVKPDPNSPERIACEKQTQCMGGCKNYGTSVDLENGSLIGWGWNGFKEGADTLFSGAGWIHFNTIKGSAKILAPWLETKFGQLFSEKIIRQWAGSGGNNATYCIYAENIYGIKTESDSCPGNPIQDVVIKSLKTTTTQNVYRNALGKIDLFGLTTSTNPNDSVKYNKYGNEIVINDINEFLADANGLRNRVFVTGSATVDSAVIKNGSEISKYGNGTVVVNGDLTINGNITYDNLQDIADVKRLASIAWIVKGDLIINENVTNTVGAFIVLGNGTSECKYENGLNCANDRYPRYLRNSYGTVFSGSSDENLTVNGLIVARAYDFRRTYTDIGKGSETIIYDGRLIANPPPGFKSFIEGFPIIRDFEFSN